MPTPDPVTEADWQAWCDSAVGEDEPPDPDEVEDPESAVTWECDLGAIVAECRRITAEEAAACARAARLGLAGGQPVGLARRCSDGGRAHVSYRDRMAAGTSRSTRG